MSLEGTVASTSSILVLEVVLEVAVSVDVSVAVAGALRSVDALAGLAVSEHSDETTLSSPSRSMPESRSNSSLLLLRHEDADMIFASATILVAGEAREREGSAPVYIVSRSFTSRCFIMSMSASWAFSVFK